MKNATTFASLAWRGLSVLLSFYLFTNASLAGDLIYTPTNPTFGGSPNNASGLLAVANAQNDYKAPSTSTPAKAPQTALDKFTASVQSAVLSRLTADTIEAIYPSKGPLVFDTPVTFGNFTVEFQKGENNSLIMITTDSSTNQQTQVTVGSVNSAP